MGGKEPAATPLKKKKSEKIIKAKLSKTILGNMVKEQLQQTSKRILVCCMHGRQLFILLLVLYQHVMYFKGGVTLVVTA